MSSHDLEVEAGGRLYLVMVDISWVRVDDSFDGHLGGYVHTFAASHWEPGEYEVEAIIDEDGENVDLEDVPGLDRAIRDAVKEATREP